MIAYKFLGPGPVSPISRFAWPVPVSGAAGAWVETSGMLAPCVRGVHVCRTVDLAHWLSDELWELETDGESILAFDCMVVRRARLLRRIDAWTDGGAIRFAEACIGHAQTLLAVTAAPTSLELVDDAKQAASAGYVSVSAHASALAVARSHRQQDVEVSFRHERAWQSQWIADTFLGPSV